MLDTILKALVGRARVVTPRMLDRAQRNMPKDRATAGGPGGAGTPSISSFMEAAPANERGTVRYATTYRAARRNHARVIRRASLRGAEA